MCSVAPAIVAGRPAALTLGDREVRLRAWDHAGTLLRAWTVPEGWTVRHVLSAGGRLYAWLHYAVPHHAPRDEWPRIAAEHSRRL